MDYGQHGAGKGDSYRQVDYSKYSKNWDKIFKPKNKTSKRLDKPKKKGNI